MIEQDLWAKLEKKKNERTNFANQIDKLFVENDQKILEEEFKQKCRHPKSQNLPENPIVNKAIQLKEIIQRTPKQKKKEWDFTETPDETAYKELYKKYPKAYEIACDKNKKTTMNDSIQEANWKFHLNVDPKNVVFVSQYLKDNNFHHKLLKGGDLEDGKVFTIYIGSYKLAKQLAKQLQIQIGNYISKPVDKTEREFEAGIIGRFDYGYKPGKAYGTCGFSINPDLKHLPKKEQELLSYRQLKIEFGSYFYE